MMQSRILNPESVSSSFREEEDEDDWSTYEHIPAELSTLDPDKLSELPAAVRHELLTAMQLHQRWGPRGQLPQDSESFSSYQVSQLLRKRRLQKEADRAHQEMRRSKGQLLLWEPDDLAGELHTRCFLYLTCFFHTPIFHRLA